MTSILNQEKIESAENDDENESSFIFAIGAAKAFELNRAFDYTCTNKLSSSSLNANANDHSNSASGYCGKCNSCQILSNLNNLKQWFDRASHITIKRFLLGLIYRINNFKLLKYLNDLLSPLTECKDYIYARNKYLPSCDEDHLKPTNDRCLDELYINKQIDLIWQWYSKATYFIKLNFILSVLKKCEQAVVFLVMLKVKSQLEAYSTNMAMTTSLNLKTHQENLKSILNQQQRTLVEKNLQEISFGDHRSDRKHQAKKENTDEHPITTTNTTTTNNNESDTELVFDAFDDEEDHLDNDDNDDYYDDDNVDDSSRAIHEAFNNIGDAAKFQSDNYLKNEARKQFARQRQENNYKKLLNSLNSVKKVDFVRQLPVHLSKYILSLLDKKSLYNCLFVCKYWSNLIREVHKLNFLHKILLDDMMFLRGTSSKGVNPRYANNVDVKVPNLFPGTNEVIQNTKSNGNSNSNSTRLLAASAKGEDNNWQTAYSGVSTRNVIMEERNVFCGPYNVLLLKEKRDPHRVIHFNSSSMVAYGSFDKKIRFIDIKSATDKSVSIKGHAGSIKSIHVLESRRQVFTGSYDTSIRCWSIDTGKCLKIYQGHQHTITCLSIHVETDKMVSGSLDKTCKVWNLSKKKCWRTFKHSYPITAVAIGEEICITGGQTGKLKVFHLLSGKLIKTINAHQSSVTCIKFDKWHIVSCSNDCYALAHSSQGKHKKCLISMRHPKEVLCLEYQYLRAITGSADGKIRIWNILNGDCIRVMRGNSQCDPILSLTIFDYKILINTEYNVILLEFESINYDYNSNYSLNGNDSSIEDSADDDDLRQKSSKRKKLKSKPYSSIRAARMELISTPNVKLFNDDRKSALEHSSRPISAKCLKEAKLLNDIVSRSQVNFVQAKNSYGDLSESALQKRQTIMQTISKSYQKESSFSGPAAPLSQIHPNNRPFTDKSATATEHRVKSTTTTINNNYNNNNNSNYDNYFYADQTVDIDDLDEARTMKSASTNNFKYSTSLNQTKIMLRDQLKELKQKEQEYEQHLLYDQKQLDIKKQHLQATTTPVISKAEKDSIDEEKQVKLHKEIDSKSCIESKSPFKVHLTKELLRNNEWRPSSSPSRVDTKTKVKIKANEIERLSDISFWSSMKQAASSSSQQNLKSVGGEGGGEQIPSLNLLFLSSSSSGTNTNMTGDMTQQQSSREYVKSVNALKFQMVQQVSKLFVETPKLENKTNKNMYPLNIDSKIPTQKMLKVVSTLDIIDSNKKPKIMQKPLLLTHQTSVKNQKSKKINLTLNSYTDQKSNISTNYLNNTNEQQNLNALTISKKFIDNKTLNNQKQVKQQQKNVQSLNTTPKKNIKNHTPMSQLSFSDLTMINNGNNLNSLRINLNSRHKSTSSRLVNESLLNNNTNSKNQLLANDHLNLMTYKQIDKVIEQMTSSHGLSSTNSSNNTTVTKENSHQHKKNPTADDIHKNLWILKSTGKYHGSLLAKHKTIAPELRE